MKTIKKVVANYWYKIFFEIVLENQPKKFLKS